MSIMTCPVWKLVPTPIEVLSDRPKLGNEVPRQVLGLDLTPLLPPQPHQGGLVAAHDDPGVGAADKVSPLARNFTSLTHMLSICI